MKLGENWENINQKAHQYVLPLGIAAIVLTFGYVVVAIIRKKRQGV
jgi:membrane protein DedA with SNARE-associated domain